MTSPQMSRFFSLGPPSNCEHPWRYVPRLDGWHR